MLQKLFWKKIDLSIFLKFMETTDYITNLWRHVRGYQTNPEKILWSWTNQKSALAISTALYIVVHQYQSSVSVIELL